MPGGMEESKAVIDFVAELSKDTYLNLMDQYRPAYHAFKYPEISRRIDFHDYETLVRYAAKSGLKRLDGING
jgi:putative pyruvate formate lyase activating enzyme